jgi:endonuclease YncB( thermonuclease family)
MSGKSLHITRPSLPRAWPPLLVLLLVLVCGSAFADFSGQVVGVSDGDTLTVLVQRKQVKIRIVDIDAPEAKQPFGSRSKQHLSTLCFGQTALVVDKGRDRYKRTLGKVSCNGIDAGSTQVRAGMAWVFRRYAPNDSPLYDLEREAMLSRRGLWSNPNAMPPWEWRQAKRKANN